MEKEEKPSNVKSTSSRHAIKHKRTSALFSKHEGPSREDTRVLSLSRIPFQVAPSRFALLSLILSL